MASQSSVLLIYLSMLPMLVLVVWISVRAFRKAGRSGWWCILVLIPIVNIIMVWVFAFMRWPSLPDKKTNTATATAD